MHYKGRHRVSWDDDLAWRGLCRVNWQQLGAMINANLNSWEPQRNVGTCVRVCRCLQLCFLFCPCSLLWFGLWSSFGPVFEHWHARIFLRNSFPNKFNKNKNKKSNSFAPQRSSHIVSTVAHLEICLPFGGTDFWILTESVAIILFPWTGLLFSFLAAILVTAMKMIGQCLCVHGPCTLWPGLGECEGWRIKIDSRWSPVSSLVKPFIYWSYWVTFHGDIV